ncbi:hypothetical protein ISN73_15975 [Dyella acidisoli]
MRLKIVMCLLCTTVLVAPLSAREQLSPPSTTELLTRFGTAPNGLARYEYLTSVMPLLTGEDKSFAKQLLATVDSELGLYNEAVMAFPFDNRVAPPKSTPLPQPDQWQAVDAADAITKLVAKHRIVMVNESHHDAHTRELTLALLPRLRALGFQYFAVEALSPKDTDLMRRGYVTETSGSEYVLEPLYGEIVRQAIRLGYTIVAYDPEDAASENRDGEEALTLKKKVFDKDSQAKLFVHAGYAHIDKAGGNLGSGVQPMAMQLKRLVGEDPLSVDQTQFHDVAVGGLDFGFYNTVASHFPAQEPYVLRARSDGTIWSSNPQQHDVTVVLPPASDSDLDVNGIVHSDVLRREVILPRPPFDLDRRPPWLTLGGARVAYPISTDLCDSQIPCVIDAHYPNEPDGATPADRYTFLHKHSHNNLYLFPGHYRLRAWDATGKTLHQQDIDVPLR